jgi:hypothetical protein
MSLEEMEGGFGRTRKPRVELILILTQDAFPDNTTDVRIVNGVSKVTLDLGKW